MKFPRAPWFLLLAAPQMWLLADDLPLVRNVEPQPLLAQVRRLKEAHEFFGQPLPAAVRQQLDLASGMTDAPSIAAAVQRSLDPLCVGALVIRPGRPLEFIASNRGPNLAEQGWRTLLVKIVNEAGATQSLRVDSPAARPLPESPQDMVSERWLDLELMDRRPLSEALSGLALEYRVLGVWARTSGVHTATLSFSLGKGGDAKGRPEEVDSRVWNFERDAEGWEAQNQLRFESRDGTLVLHSTGADPFLGVNVRMAPGDKRIRFRARTFEDATWQVFWWTTARPRPDGGHVNSFVVSHNDGKWEEYQLIISAEDRLEGFRLDPGMNAGESALDWIEIRSLDEAGTDWARGQVTFLVEATRRVQFRVRDERGDPAVAAFIVRDDRGRVYPMQTKRLGGDFFFQPQIYRGDGETLVLPEGNYSVECSRGPESIPELRTLQVTSARERRAVPSPLKRGSQPASNIVDYQVRRWVNPATRGWYSGDHHIHAAGCLHYNKPEEGVHPEDMQRHIMGEDLKVGCSLT